MLELGTTEKETMQRRIYCEKFFEAMKRVKGNKGAAGIDGMTVDELEPWCTEHGRELVSDIWFGRYKPNPVRRKEIPKADGGVRKLGIPTVIDRMVQQAIAQVLQPMYEGTFCKGSYGYRVGRSAQQAMESVKEYAEKGYQYVVEVDLSKYFDTLNHDLLLNILRRKIKDKRLIELIKKFLKSGVMDAARRAVVATIGQYLPERVRPRNVKTRSKYCKVCR